MTQFELGVLIAVHKTWERLANAAERAFPPHGWETCQIDTPEIREFERDGWEVWQFVSPANGGTAVFMRRPVQAPEGEGHDCTCAECAECGATGRTKHSLGPGHETTCSLYIPF